MSTTLTNRDKVLLLVLAGVLILFAVYMTVVKDYNAKRDAAEAQLAELTPQLQQLQEYEANQKNYAAKTTKMGNEIATQMQRFPNDIRSEHIILNAKTLQDALNDEFTEGAGYDSFAVLDVDGDGKLDVVLNVTVNGEALGYLVLTSADEVICVYGCYYRAMIGLKEDGSFSFSSSAAESGVATFYKDENRDAQYNVLAESKLDENGNVVYFVNGEAADEDAFTAVINAQNEKADATFVPATAENLALYLTIE